MWVYNIQTYIVLKESTIPQLCQFRHMPASNFNYYTSLIKYFHCYNFQFADRMITKHQNLKSHLLCTIHYTIYPCVHKKLSLTNIIQYHILIPALKYISIMNNVQTNSTVNHVQAISTVNNVQTISTANNTQTISTANNTQTISTENIIIPRPFPCKQCPDNFFSM